MSKIELSVIIATHNRKDLLFYELERIYKQKDVVFEIIVLNDIETPDPTDEITRIYPDVIYIKDNNIQGPGNKYKKGYSIAKGEFLYMPNDDDYLVDDKFFKKAVDKLYEVPQIAFVSGQVNVKYEHEDSKLDYYIERKIPQKGIINGNIYLQNFQGSIPKPASTVSTVFRKNTLSENMIEMSDSSLYMHSLLYGDAYIIDDVVAVYRTKANSLTSTAGYTFIMNVLKQKEQIFLKLDGRIQYPKLFWKRHFCLTFNLYCNNPKEKNGQLKVLKWALKHNHGSVGLILSLIWYYFKLLLK